MALGTNLIKKNATVDIKLADNVEDQVMGSIDDGEEGLEDFVEHSPEAVKNLQQFCVFKTTQEEYAIPIDLVQEVVKFTKPTPLPHMPSYIKGMTNIRGNIYGILDIELFFNLDTNIDHNYLLVLDHEIYKMAIEIPEVPDSIIVDETEIEKLNSSTIKSEIGQKYLKGVIKKEKRMIILFDIEGIISSDKFTAVN